ncbi:MAG: TetR/AcrR family transcriptional regulator, partial [Hyphomonadaceae bacterium]|nr:TetR/AcrR family transcriptional regulator [Hyphomonadaceae bacterium]
MAASKSATMDRRVARTRRTLQQALLALMLKNGYEAITVEDICAEADAGRSTFYAHFTSKDDLKRSGLDDHLRKMLIERQREAKAAAANGESFAFALVFFEHAKSHLDIYRALVSKGGAATTIGGAG